MNKIFKVVWSRVKHCYVVTSEIARSNGRSKSSTTTRQAAIVCALALTVLGGMSISSATVVSVNAPDGTFQVNNDNQNLVVDPRFNTEPNVIDLNGKPADHVENTVIGAGNRLLGDGIVQGQSSTTSPVKNNIVLGNKNTVASHYGITIGEESTVNDGYSIGIGYRAKSNASNAIAIGQGTNVNGIAAIGIGMAATVKDGATWGVALGQHTSVGDESRSSVALGDTATVGSNTIAGNAIGYLSKVGNNSTSSIALGHQSTVADNTEKGMAVGSGSSVNTGSTSAMALGTGANVGTSAVGATALGNAASIGNGASFASAIGYFAGVGTNSIGSVAHGYFAKVGDNARDGLAMGTAAKVGSGTYNSVAIGRSASVADNTYNATAIGLSTSVAANSGIAMGTQAKVNAGANRSVAIGSNTNVTTADSVVLGSYSSGSETATKETTGTIIASNGSTITYGNYVGAPVDGAGNVLPGFYVSVGRDGGERQIKNVAAGKVAADSTDAINGSQLYATNKVVADLATNDIKLGGNSGTTDAQALNKDGGLQFNVKGDGTYVTTKAAGTDVTVDLTQGTKDKIDNAADKNLSNITNEGAKNITKLGTIVKAGNNVTVTDVSDPTTGQTTYTVNAITPAVYTDKAGHKVYPTKNADGTTTWKDENGNVVNTGDVITSFESPAGSTTDGGNIVNNIGSAIQTPGSTDNFLTQLDKANTATPHAAVNVSDLKNTSDALRANELHIAPTTVKAGSTETKGGTANASGVNTYTYDATTKQVVMTYNDGNGNAVTDTKAVIDLSNLPTGGSMDSFNVKSTATDGTVATGSQGEQAIKDGKTVEMQAGKNLTIKQTNTTDGNAQVEYSLADNIVIGKDGVNGVDGTIGVNGKDGASVVIDGKDGSIGLTGPKGADGKDGASATISVKDGEPGVDGQPGVDGKTRIVYETKDANGNLITEEVATLNDGLKFTGNNEGTVNKHKLNTLVKVQGEGTQEVTKADGTKEIQTSTGEAFTSAKDNIVVEANGTDTLTVKLNKDLQNINSINNGNSSITINENPGGQDPDGNTIPAVTIDGGSLDMSGNQIVNQGSGATGKDANNNPIYGNDTNGANIGDVKNIVNESGWTVKTSADIANGGTLGTAAGDESQDIKNGKSVDFQAGKNITVTQTNDGNGNATINVAVNKDLKGLDSIGINGKDGKDGLTIKGGDGKNGVDGTSITRIEYVDKNGNKQDVATLNDGMKYAGDNGQTDATKVINKKLNEQLDIVGGADATKLTDNNIGVNANNGKLEVKLVKDIDLTDTGSIKIGDTAVNNGGLTINNGPSVTKDGINAGNKTITNVLPGVNGTDAVNVNQLKATEQHIKPGTYTVGQDGKVTMTYVDGNGADVANQTAVITGVAKSDLSNITNDGKKVITGLGTKVTSTDGSVAVNGTPDPTTGQMTYDLSVAKQDLSTAKLNYKSNNDAATAQSVTLAKGLDFTNGNYTTASVGADGVVKYDVTLGDAPTITDGKAGIPGKDGNPGKDGIATIGEVVNIVNNTGWKANAAGNVEGTTTATVVKPGDTVNYAAGSNLVVSQTVGTNEQTYTFSLSDNITAGKNGKDGKDGSIGATGKDGNSVVLNGKDGSIGLTGKDGRDGVNGRDGASIDITTAKGEQVLVNRDPNNAGDTDQAERIVYMPKDKDGNYIKGEDGKNIVREVATMDDGLKFTGNNESTTNNHKLNTLVKVQGERTDGKTSYTAGESAANNLIVEADGNSTLTVKMAKDLINLNSVTAGTAKLGNQSTTTAGGEEQNGNYVTGLDNKKWDVKNPDIVSGRAATEDQLKVVSDAIKTTETDIINKGFGLAADDKKSVTKPLGNTISIVGKETTGSDGTGHKNITTSVEGDKVNIALNKDLDLGKDGFIKIGDTTINNDGLTIVGGPSITKDGINAGGKTITNVAPGVNGTDAVNVDQLNNAINNNKTKLVDGKNTTVTGDGSTTNPYKVNVADQITLGAKDGKDGKNGVDGSIGVNGKDGSAVVINGKDGSIGLNGKDGANGLTIKGDKGQVGVDGTDGANGKDGMTRIVYEDKNGTKHEVATMGDGLKFTGNNTDTTNVHKLNTLVKVQGEGVDVNASKAFQSAAGNINVVANGSDTLEVRLNKDLTNISSISNTTNGPTISFGDTSVNITNGNLNMGGNRITNVAPGKDKTDVATVGQMIQVTSKDESVLVSESTNADGAKVYDLSVQSVDGRVARELANEIGRVGAQGAALAALKPIQYDPLEPTQIMAGYGNYRGNSALALGVAHYKNESTMIHGGVSWAAGDGNHMMANAGITWKVGSRDSEAAIADRYRKGPISSAYALQNEMAAMKAENTGLKGEVAGLKAQNDQIIAENAEMKAENQEMKAQIAMLMQRLGL